MLETDWDWPRLVENDRRSIEIDRKSSMRISGKTIEIADVSFRVFAPHYPPLLFFVRKKGRPPKKQGFFSLRNPSIPCERKDAPKARRIAKANKASLDGPIRANRFADSRIAWFSRIVSGFPNWTSFSRIALRGAKSANRRLEAIRANRSYVMNQKNPRAYKNKIGTPPPPQTPKYPPPKTRNFMDMGFSCRKNAFFQPSIKLTHPFPAPELRTKILRTLKGFSEWK